MVIMVMADLKMAIRYRTILHELQLALDVLISLQTKPDDVLDMSRDFSKVYTSVQ